MRREERLSSSSCYKYQKKSEKGEEKDERPYMMQDYFSGHAITKKKITDTEEEDDG